MLVELGEGRFDVYCNVHVAVRPGRGEESGIKEIEEVLYFSC